MVIKRKAKEITKTKAEQIRVGECFFPDCSPDDLYERTSGEYNRDDHYAISATRLSDGYENRFTKEAIVLRAIATVSVEK